MYNTSVTCGWANPRSQLHFKGGLSYPSTHMQGFPWERTTFQIPTWVRTYPYLLGPASEVLNKLNEPYPPSSAVSMKQWYRSLQFFSQGRPRPVP